MHNTVVTVSDHVRFIEDVFGTGKLARNAKNIDVRCPICAPLDASKKKLAILTDDGRCHCWVCGFRSRTLLPLLKKYATTSKFQEYVTVYVPGLGINVPKPGARCTWFELNEVERPTLPADFRLLATSSLKNPDDLAAIRYLTSRKIDRDDMWYYRLGVSDEPRWKRRVIVPSFDSSGELNYYVARAVDRRVRPKYDNPDVDKLPIIFNESNVTWDEPVVVCEGAFDMFKCGENVVALLGSDINEQSALFDALIVNLPPILLALDGDMWETKTLKIAKKLTEYKLDVKIVDTRPFIDPGSASKEEFKSALADAKPFEWSSYIKTRLERASRVSLHF